MLPAYLLQYNAQTLADTETPYGAAMTAVRALPARQQIIAERSVLKMIWKTQVYSGVTTPLCRRRTQHEHILLQLLLLATSQALRGINMIIPGATFSSTKLCQYIFAYCSVTFCTTAEEAYAGQ